MSASTDPTQHLGNYVIDRLKRAQHDGLWQLPVTPADIKTVVEEAATTSSLSPTPATEEPQRDHQDSIAAITAELKDCQRCKLSKRRKNVVIGRGNPNAELMFIGEGPGHDEDIQGKPFVGKAGQLLDKIIIAMGFDPSEVYIANIVKCRPPNNRNPEPDEIDTCVPYLKRQIDVVAPKVLCALGAVAAQTLLKSQASMARTRGRFHKYNDIPLLATYHPAYLLRNPDAKKLVWEDVQKISKMLARDVVQKGSKGR